MKTLSKTMTAVKWVRDARGWVVVGLVMIAVGLAPARWTASAGVDVWNIPKYQAEIEENKRLAKVMEVESQILTQRIATKDVLVKELLAGRADLATVSQQFLLLNNEDPDMIAQLKKHYHIEDDRAACALNVLAFAESLLDANGSPQKPVVLKRLDDEFDRLFPQYESLGD